MYLVSLRACLNKKQGDPTIRYSLDRVIPTDAFSEPHSYAFVVRRNTVKILLSGTQLSVY